MDDKTAWVIFYTQIVGWTYHPGYQREGAKPPSLRQAAEQADEMVKHLRRRKWQQCGEESQQESAQSPQEPWEPSAKAT